MGLEKLSAVALIALLAACNTTTQTAKPRERILLHNYGLAICLGTAFDSSELRSDVNKAAVGYMERGELPLEAYEDVRTAANEWLKRDYPGKRGGQVNSAKCIDFYRSDELQAVFIKHAG